MRVKQTEACSSTCNVQKQKVVTIVCMPWQDSEFVIRNRGSEAWTSAAP